MSTSEFEHGHSHEHIERRDPEGTRRGVPAEPTEDDAQREAERESAEERQAAADEGDEEE